VFAEYEIVSGMQTIADADAVHDEAGTVADPTRGAVAVELWDCGSPDGLGPAPMNVAGATVDAPPGATVIYAGATGLADADLTETSSRGLALLLNVEPGEVDVTVHAASVTYRARPVKVVAGALTWTLRHP
jgi:hypothetical protein